MLPGPRRASASFEGLDLTAEEAEPADVHLAAAVIPVPAAVALALLARLVTTLGDLWFALAASVATLPGATVRNGG